ncbi:MAG: FkbM family methyltransferase [Opitutae bacterium]|nr:FkbM family methyltransferase [Opitutae bacterium]
MIPFITNLLKEAAITFLLKSSDYSLRTYSQAGQDLWVHAELYPQRKRGFFIEIGAVDGIQLSNTYMLEKHLDWRGICIEANPTSFESLKKNRTSKCVHACLDDKEHEVDFALNDLIGGIVDNELDNTPAEHGSGKVIRLKTKTLNQVLQEAGAPKEIHYMSIDVEGAEERVLRNFDFEAYQINAITVERPTPSLRKLLADKGYIIVKEICGLDCFYVHESLYDKNRNSIITNFRNGVFVHRYTK